MTEISPYFTAKFQQRLALPSYRFNNVIHTHLYMRAVCWRFLCICMVLDLRSSNAVVGCVLFVLHTHKCKCMLHDSAVHSRLGGSILSNIRAYSKMLWANKHTHYSYNEWSLCWMIRAILIRIHTYTLCAPCVMECSIFISQKSILTFGIYIFW